MSDSVISIFRLVGSSAGGLERLLDERDQIGIHEMPDRKIHAHGQRAKPFRTLGVPHRELPAGLAEAPLADLRHETQVRGNLQEPIRSGEPILQDAPSGAAPRNPRSDRISRYNRLIR